MKLVAISPESDEPREHAVLAALFAAGLERYHVRKPQWPREKLAGWLGEVAQVWRYRLVLHQQHELAVEFGCGGVHFKAGEVAPQFNGPVRAAWASRSCHDLAALDESLGRFSAVFFSPVFASISKPGYQPMADLGAVAARLARRTQVERTTEVIALGGITPANTTRCAGLGFDGVAVLGALWQAPDPLQMYHLLRRSLTAHAA